jgi:hypothetical protein
MPMKWHCSSCAVFGALVWREDILGLTISAAACIHCVDQKAQVCPLPLLAATQCFVNY